MQTLIDGPENGADSDHTNGPTGDASTAKPANETSTPFVNKSREQLLKEGVTLAISSAEARRLQTLRKLNNERDSGPER